MTTPQRHDAGSHLWRCYELSGADTSDGPYPGWEHDAVNAVRELRIRNDLAGDWILNAIDALKVLRGHTPLVAALLDVLPEDFKP